MSFQIGDIVYLKDQDCHFVISDIDHYQYANIQLQPLEDKSHCHQQSEIYMHWHAVILDNVLNPYNPRIEEDKSFELAGLSTLVSDSWDQPKQKCNCLTFDLINFGCKCGGI